MLMVLSRYLFKPSLGILPLLAISLFAQTEDVVGIKVLAVKDGSEAVRAGIEAGDVISSWRSGSLSGGIASPFEFNGIELEQGPRGAVTLSGFRRAKEISWTVNSPRGALPAAWFGLMSKRSSII